MDNCDRLLLHLLIHGRRAPLSMIHTIKNDLWTSKRYHKLRCVMRNLRNWVERKTVGATYFFRTCFFFCFVFHAGKITRNLLDPLETHLHHLKYAYF